MYISLCASAGAWAPRWTCAPAARWRTGATHRDWCAAGKRRSALREDHLSWPELPGRLLPHALSWYGIYRPWWACHPSRGASDWKAQGQESWAWPRQQWEAWAGWSIPESAKPKACLPRLWESGWRPAWEKSADPVPARRPLHWPNDSTGENRIYPAPAARWPCCDAAFATPPAYALPRAGVMPARFHRYGPCLFPAVCSLLRRTSPEQNRSLFPATRDHHPRTPPDHTPPTAHHWSVWPRYARDPLHPWWKSAGDSSPALAWNWTAGARRFAPEPVPPKPPAARWSPSSVNTARQSWNQTPAAWGQAPPRPRQGWFSRFAARVSCPARNGRAWTWAGWWRKATLQAPAPSRSSHTDGGGRTGCNRPAIRRPRQYTDQANAHQTRWLANIPLSIHSWTQHKPRRETSKPMIKHKFLVDPTKPYNPDPALRRFYQNWLLPVCKQAEGVAGVSYPNKHWSSRNGTAASYWPHSDAPWALFTKQAPQSPDRKR